MIMAARDKARHIRQFESARRGCAPTIGTKCLAVERESDSALGFEPEIM